MRKFLLLIFVIVLMGCSEQEEKLTRITANEVFDEGSSVSEEIIITDPLKLEEIAMLLKNVNWQPNTKAEMARQEDIYLTLFYDRNDNMPERLYTYLIWIGKDESMTIISSKEEEGYGRLNSMDAKKLKTYFKRK